MCCTLPIRSRDHCTLKRIDIIGHWKLCRLTGLIECAKKKSFTIDTRSNKTLAVSLDRSVDPNDPEFNRVKILKCITQSP